jgi:prevent-host-death family protein
MEAVGASAAKTHLSALLDRIAKGEKITITRHGVPVAVLGDRSQEFKRS